MDRLANAGGSIRKVRAANVVVEAPRRNQNGIGPLIGRVIENGAANEEQRQPYKWRKVMELRYLWSQARLPQHHQVNGGPDVQRAVEENLLTDAANAQPRQPFKYRKEMELRWLLSQARPGEHHQVNEAPVELLQLAKLGPDVQGCGQEKVVAPPRVQMGKNVDQVEARMNQLSELDNEVLAVFDRETMNMKDEPNGEEQSQEARERNVKDLEAERIKNLATQAEKRKLQKGTETCDLGGDHDFDAETKSMKEILRALERTKDELEEERLRNLLKARAVKAEQYRLRRMNEANEMGSGPLMFKTANEAPGL